MAVRPAPGPAPPGAPLEAGVQEPGVDQLVQVVGGQGPGDPDRGRRLVPPDAAVAAGDAVVQLPPQRVAEAGQGGQPLVQVVLRHTPF